MHPTTELIHHPYQPPAGFAAPQIGVHKASTVIFANVAAMRNRDWQHKSGYTYGLHGTPTTFVLEERIATLEHAKHCVLAPSGLAAVALPSLALCGMGDEVLLPSNSYGPNTTLAQTDLARFGITHGFYDPMQPESLASAITPRTKLVWLEVPGSISMEFADLPALLAVCKAKGVLTAFDNTWGAGLAFNAFEVGAGLGADVVVQALTKFPSGGGDVLMGSVCTRRDDLHAQIKATHMHLGYGVGANDVEAVLRSLPSIALRYDAQDRAGRALAEWWAKRPEIAQVLHPALASGVGHAHWKALCGASNRAAGLFSVVFDARYGQAAVDAFCDALELFKLGYSWAGPMSLVVPYDMVALRAQSKAAWPANGVAAGCLVRFSMGLEAVEDLQTDLERGLEALRRAT